MKKKELIFIISTVLCMNLHAQDVPNAPDFLPGPPSELSMWYVNDYAQYTWGKSVRNTSRGEQAISDMSLDLSSYLTMFSKVLGIELSYSKTPQIYSILEYGMRYGDLATQAGQTAFFSRRPYTRLNESSLLPGSENQYSSVSSYPSAQALTGWLCALILTEVCNDRQDQLLARGLQFGTSAVISGYSWDSDTYAGCLIASAVLSRLHTHDGFSKMITAAKSEYEQITGTRTPATTRADDGPYIDTKDLPSSLTYLPVPPDSQCIRFAYDMMAYNDGKSIRYNDQRGQTAIDDVEYDAQHFCEIYSQILGVNISASTTPEIYELINRVHPSGNAATQEAKAYYMRKRPYVQLNEGTSYPDDEASLYDTGSYPSGHASGSWLMALVISEITRTSQDALLKRAYQFGQGRVITGYHWQTDVEAGRLVGSVVYARLHSSREFLEQVDKAVKEFKGLSSGIRATRADESINTKYYTIDGIRLDQEPVRHGVYIEGNKKVAK